MFHRRDHHPAPVFGLLRGTSQVLPVHGDRRMCRAVLAGPLTDGVVQGLGRQRGERARCSAACSGSRTHPLPRAAPGRAGRRTGRTRSHLGSRPDGQRRRSPERCSSACPGQLGRPDTRTGCAAAAPPLACVAQRSSVPAPRSGSAPRRRRRSVRTRRWPWWRQRAEPPGSRAKPRVSPSERQFRRAVAGPDKARDIHERLRQKGAPPGCPAIGRRLSAPARPSCAPGQHLVGDQMQEGTAARVRSSEAAQPGATIAGAPEHSVTGGKSIAWKTDRNNFLSGLKVRDEGARTC